MHYRSKYLPRRQNVATPSKLATNAPLVNVQARSAVMCMSSVPWHAPLKISVCMRPESDPSGWGV
jgi:hypothetical protein